MCVCVYVCDRQTAQFASRARGQAGDLVSVLGNTYCLPWMSTVPPKETMPLEGLEVSELATLDSAFEPWNTSRTLEYLGQAGEVRRGRPKGGQRSRKDDQ